MDGFLIRARAIADLREREVCLYDREHECVGLWCRGDADDGRYERVVADQAVSEGAMGVFRKQAVPR